MRFFNEFTSDRKSTLARLSWKVQLIHRIQRSNLWRVATRKKFNFHPMCFFDVWTGDFASLREVRLYQTRPNRVGCFAKRRFNFRSLKRPVPNYAILPSVRSRHPRSMFQKKKEFHPLHSDWILFPWSEQTLIKTSQFLFRWKFYLPLSNSRSCVTNLCHSFSDRHKYCKVLHVSNYDSKNWACLCGE